MKKPNSQIIHTFKKKIVKVLIDKIPNVADVAAAVLSFKQNRLLIIFRILR